MITLQGNKLVFNFPEVHPSAVLTFQFPRTLRIPDDDTDYPLPPGLGRFPLRLVDDFPTRVPQSWLASGGVMLPMYQAEAMWLYFDGALDEERWVEYPFAIKIATGKINAVSGQTWQDGIHRHPQQDYMVVPKQPWLDGYCVEKGIVRQFVAMPMGAGYTAEEQVTGKAEHGGLQIVAYPMKRRVFERRFPKRTPEDALRVSECTLHSISYAPAEMGLAPGGRMKQEIYDDPYKLADWDTDHPSRCFIHIANSMVWRQITGENPPTTPPTSKQYTDAGLPWFMWYDEHATALEGNATLAKMKSVTKLAHEKNQVPLPENEAVIPGHIIALRYGLKAGQVREFRE